MHIQSYLLSLTSSLFIPAINPIAGSGISIYIIISKKYPLSPLKPRGLAQFFMTCTLQLTFREFGAPIIYMIPVPLLT